MNFYWVAIYKDGTKLMQYNADGSENKYTDIDRSKLAQFVLCQLNNGKPLAILHLTSNQRLIYRRRVAQKITGEKTVVYLVGWQETVEGKNRQIICFVFSDGHIEVVNRFYENHPWFYSVILRPEEKL